MTDDNKRSKVDELSDTLYSRTRYQDPQDKRSAVKNFETADVLEKWHSPELNEMLSQERVIPPLNPFMKKFFVFAVLFFIATLLVAGFVFLGGSNFISSKNVDVNVVGPTVASAGQIVELGVTIENKNNTDLELANLSVQYPEDSRDPQDSSRGLTFAKYDLGVVKAGGEASRNVRMILLGSTGEVKEIKLSVEYKVRGSNATFYKDKIYEITIGDAPLSISIVSPPKVSSGESFTTEVLVTLNSPETLRNVMLRAEYPYGYSAESSSPEAIAENNVWSLGDMPPGSSKKIQIRGRLVGENQDERTFRFYIGVGIGESATPNFKSILVSSQETVAIERPSIGLNISFNGENTLAYVAPAGQSIYTTIKFQNNSPDKLVNPRLEVRLSGSALNSATISPQNNGSYNATSRRINWSPLNLEGVPELAPGEGDVVTFSFSTPADTIASGSRELTLQFIFTGTSVADNKPVTVTESRTIKIGSEVSLSSRAVHSIGPFENTGPMPPQAGKVTTYTVLWSVSNTSNELSNAKVTAKLGPGVKWTGSQGASEEIISNDLSSNTVIWDLSSLSSGTGFSQPRRSIAFQVALTPSANQIGGAATLVNNIVFSGRDNVLNKNITVTSGTLTTRISTDPAFIQGDEVVQK